MATWNFEGQFDPPSGPPDEWVWERLRDRRNRFLSETDFRMVVDAPWDIEPWAVYRQALRDLPEQTSDPREAVWPNPPTD